MYVYFFCSRSLSNLFWSLEDLKTTELTGDIARRHLGDEPLEVRRDEPLLVLGVLVVQRMVDHQRKVHHQLEQLINVWLDPV